MTTTPVPVASGVGAVAARAEPTTVLAVPTSVPAAPTGQAITIRYSWYWPALLGPNCATSVAGQCLSPIAGCYPHNAGWADRARFCQHTQSIGKGYWRTNWPGQAAERVVACPSSWAFGTRIRAFGETWTCADRGGKIVGNWVDFLTPRPHLQYGQHTEVEVLR